ncbi:putative Ig domain-containing protein [Arenimonas alkanexedens]
MLPKSTARVGLTRLFVMGWLLLAGLAWSSLATAQHTSTLCPPQVGTVANGGSVVIDVTDCNDFFGPGVGAVQFPPANGTATLSELFTPPSTYEIFVTYTHNGSATTTDSFGFQDEYGDRVQVSMTISPATSAIVVSPASISPQVGVAFSTTLTSAGGTAPYTYSLESGSLPAGLSLSSGGLLSGTPTQRAPFSFTVRSQDSLGDFVLKTYSGTIASPAISATPTSTALVQGTASGLQYVGTGGIGPYTFSVNSGTVPTGTALQANGALTGTPSATGTFNFDLVVNDSTTDPTCPGCDFFAVVPVTINVTPPPSVSIAVAPASVSEDGATNLVYTLTRSLNLGSPTVVNLTTTGTATAGSDYTGNVATVSIPAGATTATVTIDPTADATVEANETVILTVATGAGYIVGAPASATGTILNDDISSATIAVAPASVSEDGAANLVYTVTLDQAALAATSVNFTVAGTATSGVDYAAVTSPLVIAAGNLSGTITVNPTADATIEADETVILTLAAGAGYTVGAPASATGTILNDDLPNLTINDVTANEGNAGTTNFTFTVSLSAPAGPGGVSFDIGTANGTATAGVDYVANSLTGQTIAAGASTYTFTVLVNGDALNEPNESFFVNVTNVTGAVVTDGQGLGTITNDDALPSLAIDDVTVAEGNVGSTSAVFTVTLGAASGQTVSVNYATADGTATQPADYTSTSGTLTFTPGQTTRTVTVQVIGDTVPEANETYFVNLSGATNATIADNQGLGTITNDDVPVTVTPATVPAGTVATAYSQTLAASGGAAPYSFALAAGALPGGLTLSAGGTLSGTPTAGGTFNFTATATDSSPFPGPFSGSRAYSLVINAPTISLPATPLAGGTLGSAYSAAITPASAGTAPYAYALTAGALPGGLTLNPATGAITGTPSALGSFNFSVTATDSSTGSGPYAATQAYAITVINVPPVANAVSVSVPFNAAATNVALNITGGAATSVAIGTAATNGTAIATGTSITYQPNAGYSGADSFTYTATNSGGTSAPATVSVTVTDPVISITNGNPLTGTVAVAYTQTFSFNGGTASWSSYQVTNLPAGVSLTGFSANTVTVSGTPTQAGAFALNVSATDSSTGNGPFTIGQVFNLSIGAPVLTMTPAPGTLNAPYAVAYSQAFSAGGGTGPYTYAITGALPAGVSFSGGTLSGTPTAPGSYPITITATDTGSTGTGAPFTIAQNYTLEVPAPLIAVAPSTLPSPVAGAAYSQAITASGGVAPYGFAVTAGSLPNGLTLSGAGSLSGTATQVGAFNFTITATDANGQTGSRAYSFNVAAPVLTMTPAPGTLTAPYGAAYSQTFTAGGSPGPYSYALTGALPAGVSFSGGTLSGTPTVPGSFPITVTATDTGLTGAGAPFSIAQNYTLNVPAPTIVVNPATLANGTAGQAYTASLSATGAVAPYSFAVTAGALPPGMTLSAGGALSGTPTSSGSFNLTVTGTDANGQTGARAYALVIDVPVLVITPATLPAGIVGVGYSQPISASGGVAPYSFALSAGALPGGLTLAANGTLSGTPTTQGNFAFTVTATDSTGGTAATAAQAYSVEIVFAPPVAVDDTATVLAGATVSIPVTANDTSAAPITSIAIVSPPASGTATVSGLDVSYTAATLSPASVTFTYTATGPGGTSAPATVTVTVNPLPIATNFDVTTTPATPVSVTLTAGATGGPFTGADVVSVSPAASGTATIAASGGNYVLTFTPDAAFSGVVVVEFTLDNAFATSAVGTVTITVEQRPDPSQDAEVQGMLDAQVEATRRFATAQIGNFQQRLERLHRGGGGNDGVDNSLGFSVRPQCIESVVTDWMDPCSDTLGANGDGRGPAGNAAAGDGRRSGGGRDSALNAWVGGMIRSGSQDGRNGGADVSFETDGASAGMDYRVNPTLAIGAGIGYGRDDNEVGANGSRVKGDATTLATYASYHPGERFYLDGLLGFQRIAFDLRRYVTPTDAFVYGQRDGDQWFASVSTGADIRQGAVTWNPYLRLDVARATLDGYTETGDAVYALRFGAMDVDTTTGNLGLRVDSAHTMTWGVFSPMFRVEYQHDFNGRANASVQYADLVGGPAYPLTGTAFDNNRWILGLGARFDLESDWSFGLEYRGQVGSDGERDNGLLLNIQKNY